MWDSINPGQLPRGGAAYAGYVGGRWPTWVTLTGMFPGAHLLSIAIAASEDADCLDVETGDATIAQVHGWFTRQRQRGLHRPVLYISAGLAADLIATMTANGYARSEYRLWTAHYGLGEHICGTGCGYPQADGTQWTSTALGRTLDQSLLTADFFTTTPPPAPPPPAPVPVLEDPVIELDTTVKSHPLLLPYGTPTMDLLSVATQGTPTQVRVTWLDEGNKPVDVPVSWGAAGSEPSLKVPKGIKKARLDITSGGGPRLAVRFNPPAQ
jgi:hypothetical protein